MFDEEDRTEKYVLVGIVSGNPKGCVNGERLFPDFHVSVGNEEVIHDHILYLSYNSYNL